MAMYDLMGKAAGVPVYKLFGQSHRSWVPVCELLLGNKRGYCPTSPHQERPLWP